MNLIWEICLPYPEMRGIVQRCRGIVPFHIFCDHFIFMCKFRAASLLFQSADQETRHALGGNQPEFAVASIPQGLPAFLPGFPA